MDLVLPLIILFARIIETTMETIRQVYVTKGHKYLAATFGTLKIGIWVVSTGLVLTNLTNIPGILAYMAGYGIGTILGMNLEKWIGLGNVVIRIFCSDKAEAIMEDLGTRGYGVTRVHGSGRFVSSVSILISIVPRKEISQLLGFMKKSYPDVHFTIEDVSSMSEREIYYGEHSKRGILGFIGYE